MPSSEASLPSKDKLTRRGLLASGTAFLGAFAGCSSLAGLQTGDEDTPEKGTGTLTVETNTAEAGTRRYVDNRAGEGPLTVQTTGTMWKTVQRAAGLWNANPSPTDDHIVWERLGSRPAFDERVADHYTAAAGVATADGLAEPPFRVTTAIGEPDRTAEALVDGTLDVGGVNSRSRSSDLESTESPGSQTNAVVHHVIARQGWVFVVSPALAEAGVDALTVDQIRRVFAGDVTNWQSLGGPDREPFVFLGPDVTGDWNPAYENFLLAGDAVPAALDYRAGRATQLVRAAAERENALGVVQGHGVSVARDRGVPTLDVIINGERRGVYDERYPMTRNVYLSTLGEPNAREQAFLELFTSPYGQRVFVGRDLLPIVPPV